MTFAYKARNRDGKIEEGTVDAAAKDEAVSLLQARDIILISLSPVQDGSALSSKKFSIFKKIGMEDLVLTARQLALLLDSGVTLLRALEILASQTKNSTLASVLEKVKKDVEDGGTLREAFSRHPSIFSQFWVDIAETGEASGHLSSSLNQLADHLEVEASIRKKFVSAMIYPAILIFVAFIAITFFTVKFIPIFSGIFGNMNVELPVLTKIVISFSSIVRKFLFFIIIGSIVGIYFLKKYIATSSGRNIFDRLKLKLPVCGGFFRDIAIERFASGLGILLKSGVPILHAMDIVSRTCGNVVFENVLEQIKGEVRDGKTLAAPLSKRMDIFPVMVVHMVRVGEEIGELGNMLDKIAGFYRERIITFSERLTTIIEPVIIVFMGGIIGTMLVAMFLPIFNIASAVR